MPCGEAAHSFRQPVAEHDDATPAIFTPMAFIHAFFDSALRKPQLAKQSLGSRCCASANTQQWRTQRMG